MRGIRTKKLLFFLWGFLTFALMFSGSTVYASSQTASVSKVAQAKKNCISGGKWVRNSKGLRYRQKNGTYLKGCWCKIGKYIYCFKSNGYVRTGSFGPSNTYYADSQGRIYVNRWRKAGRKTYYYNAQGEKVRAKWKTISGKMYYFSRTGELVTNSWVGNQYVGANGARVKNTKVDGRKIDQSGAIQKLAQNDKYIIVGASRIVDMSIAANAPNTVFIAKSGMGYEWLKTAAYPCLKKYLKKSPNYKVVFQLGNNDLWNIDSYINFYVNLMTEFPDTEFYFLDATPGDEQGKNVKRQQFNEKLREAFGAWCIGGYDYLVSIRFTTIDGVHYPPSVSRALYRYVIRKIK